MRAAARHAHGRRRRARLRRLGRTPVVLVAAATVVVAVGGRWLVDDGAAPGRAADPAAVGETSSPPPTTSPSQTPTRRPRPARLDRRLHSLTDPHSVWVIVNKTHPITPSDFRPELTIVRGYQVAPAAATPLERLLTAADRAGLGLKIESTFRSYAYQEHVHAATVVSRGEAVADRLSARAGYSEHQTGLAVDLITPASPACDFRACFAHTRAGRWLARRAWRFGFVVRYTVANRSVTGYQPEPWHLRYVGRPLSPSMHVLHVDSLESYFGVRGGDYRDSSAT